MLRAALQVCGVLLVLAAGRAAAQTPPSADAGADVSVECTGAGGAEVELDGSGSSDAEGQSLTFTWTSPSFSGELTGRTPSVELPLGTHVVTLTVSDGVDGSDTDEVVVRVRDTTPPELHVGGTPLGLWPPNHAYHDVEIERFLVSVSDVCDASIDREDARFGRATSDEPENGTGDGDTPGDILIEDECRELRVRAERKGNGDGRVYEAQIVVEDSSGNASRSVVTVARVPKAPPKPALDSGVAHAVTSDCEPEGPGLCPALPQPSCDGILPRGRALVRIYEHPRSDDFDALFFHMVGLDARAADLGDPTDDTAYQLCVYGREREDDEPFRLVQNLRATPGKAWRAIPGGYVYRSRRDDDDGITTLLLRAGHNGRGAILLWGFGDDLDTPDLPLDEAAGVEVQLHNSLGQCWGASFPDAIRNTEHLFQAISR